jgi:hypothetical protein
MGGLTAALHAALRRVQSLTGQLRALKSGAAVPAAPAVPVSTPPIERAPDTELPTT